MTVPNPFDPYHRLGCYGPPGDVPADRPWWSAVYEDGVMVGWRRADGPGVACDFYEDMRALVHPMDDDAQVASGEWLRELDAEAPRARPPVLPGQVWARYVDPLATNAFDDSTRWSLDRIDFGRIRQDGGVEGGRDITTHMADRGAVLVYGPGAPWAPPEWAPGKVWDGKGWTDA